MTTILTVGGPLCLRAILSYLPRFFGLVFGEYYTANTNSQREKELWIKSINHFLNACFIKNPTELVNYLSIFENQADMWGYNGITQSSRKIGLINDNAL